VLLYIQAAARGSFDQHGGPHGRLNMMRDAMTAHQFGSADGVFERSQPLTTTALVCVRSVDMDVANPA
jgi:hypothetical protein